MMNYAECAVRALNEQGFNASVTDSGKVALTVWNSELSDSFQFILSEDEVLMHGKQYATRFEREVTAQEWEEMPLRVPADKFTADVDPYYEPERFKKALAENRIVTICDDNDGKGDYIYFGFRRVNNLGYYEMDRSLDFIGDDIFDCGSIKDVTGMTTVYFK